MDNVHVSLEYLMGLELAKGGWLATSSRSLASPGLGFQAHTTMSWVLVVALNVGARDPTQVPMLGQSTPHLLSHCHCSCQVSGLTPCGVVLDLLVASDVSRLSPSVYF